MPMQCERNSIIVGLRSMHIKTRTCNLPVDRQPLEKGGNVTSDCVIMQPIQDAGLGRNTDDRQILC